MSEKFTAGDAFPAIAWPLCGGGQLTFAAEHGWRMLVVYRGKHCGLCREYLDELNAMLDRFAKQEVRVAAVSADPRERAEAQVREQGWRFPVAYDLSVEDMRTLGLYISPAAQGATGRPFAEPAIFVVNPDGRTQVVNVSNAPYARPPLEGMLEGLETTRKGRAPIHGTEA